MAETVRDIFGNELTIAEARVLTRKGTPPKGYAAPPGTGPKGETCGTCDHILRRRLGKIYLKCGKAEYKWTGGPGSDIRARAPACRLWEPRSDG